MDSFHEEAARNVAHVSRRSDKPSGAVPLGLQCQRNSLVSIHRSLPEDILREVFVQCLPITHNSTFSPRDAPVLLTHVCRRWRNVALSTPSLWCSLHVPLRLSQDFHSAMGVWLGHAGALPLSLSFGSPADRFSSNLPDLSPYFKTLQTMPNPLHTVTLELRGEEDNIKAFLEEHRKSGFSPTQTVKKLGVRVDALNPYSIQHSVLSLLKLQENRALRGLELSAAFHILALPEGFELPTPWANLQTLDLQSHNFYDGFPMAIRLGVLLSILSRCPNLVQLKAFAAGVLHARSTMDLPDVVLHPRLRHASLFIMNLASIDNVEFLGKCDWPILTSLHLGYKGQIGSDPERGYILNKIIEKWGNRLTLLRFTYPSINREHLRYFLSQLPHLVQLHIEDGTVQKLQVGIVSDDSDSDDEDEDPPEDDVIASLTPDEELSEHFCPLLQYFRWDGRTRFSDKAVINLLSTRALSPASPVRMKQVVINFHRGAQEDVEAACSELIAGGLRLHLKYRVPRKSDPKFSGPYRGLTVEQDPLALGWM
ncbi:hypothetical protein FA13DRAFT_1807919 [Coprinellus micaceus]|uniref:Uncharacterized protein n=1 Tax=Coprinellus micaceus TaxID=71717 RepID=A0A4Y7TZ48_COPMI|nr:hypothetical protein FA13DRAFT_1807919 [Coprinellus micaceus]